MDHAEGRWRVGNRNPDPDFPDEIAIMAEIKAGDLVGSKKHPAPQSGEICVACAMPCGVRDVYPEFSDANARRIVACVNALSGVPTEAVEEFAAKGSLGEFWKRGVEDGSRRN